MSATLLAYVARRSWGTDLAVSDRIDIPAALAAIGQLRPDPVMQLAPVEAEPAASQQEESLVTGPSASPEVESLKATLARERQMFVERERVVRDQQAASAARITELEREVAALRAELAPRPPVVAPPGPQPECADEIPAAPTPQAALLAISVSGTREGMDLARFATLHGARARYDLKRGAVVADADLSAIHAEWQARKEQR